MFQTTASMEGYSHGAPPGSWQRRGVLPRSVRGREVDAPTVRKRLEHPQRVRTWPSGRSGVTGVWASGPAPMHATGMLYAALREHLAAASGDVPGGRVVFVPSDTPSGAMSRALVSDQEPGEVAPGSSEEQKRAERAM